MKEGMIIILLSLIITCIITLLILAAIIIYDIIINKYHNYIVPSAIDKCIIYLLLYCETRNIPVLFESEIFKQRENGTSVGLIKYKGETSITTGRLIAYKDFIIHIKQSRNNRFVYTTLAHEIGHYISLINYDDGSESGADYEAKKLVESFLTKKELKAMKTELDILFEHDPVIHTKSLQYRYISESQEYLYLVV